jgi:hypothetical protein
MRWPIQRYPGDFPAISSLSRAHEVGIARAGFTARECGAVEDLSYPVPKSVPNGLCQPSQRYKRNVWLALLALAGFGIGYVSLTTWFVWTAMRLLHGAFTGGSGTGFLFGLPMLLLSVFMLKALLFRDRPERVQELEVRSEDEPHLFAVLHRIADAAGAPRPHRVFLSPNVNASVYYDLSILNLVFPTKKNLVIGLGLVTCRSASSPRCSLTSSGISVSERWLSDDGSSSRSESLRTSCTSVMLWTRCYRSSPTRIFGLLGSAGSCESSCGHCGR